MKALEGQNLSTKVLLPTASDTYGSGTAFEFPILHIRPVAST